MLYPVCPTCGALLANIQIPYQQDIKKLCEEFNVDVDLMSHNLYRNEDFNKRKREILDKYTDPDNYCCRSRLPNFSDLVRIVM